MLVTTGQVAARVEAADGQPKKCKQMSQPASQLESNLALQGMDKKLKIFSCNTHELTKRNTYTLLKQEEMDTKQKRTEQNRREHLLENLSHLK